LFAVGLALSEGKIMGNSAIRSVSIITFGAILAAFFWDLDVFWFQGGPIGLFLIVLGLWDLWEARPGRPPRRGILQELRDEVVGPIRNDLDDNQDRHDR
jgi:hypothetical protein